MINFNNDIHPCSDSDTRILKSKLKDEYLGLLNSLLYSFFGAIILFFWLKLKEKNFDIGIFVIIVAIGVGIVLLVYIHDIRKINKDLVEKEKLVFTTKVDYKVFNDDFYTNDKYCIILHRNTHSVSRVSVEEYEYAQLSIGSEINLSISRNAHIYFKIEKLDTAFTNLSK